jgi:hypothetical protein
VRLLLPLKVSIHALEVILSSSELLLKVLLLGPRRNCVDLLLKLLDRLLSVMVSDGGGSDSVRRVCRKERLSMLKRVREEHERSREMKRTRPCS